MLEKKIYITHRVNALKLKAAQKYNIAPEKCHIGHVVLQAMIDSPNNLNQIDAATDTNETNISVAIRSMRLASAMNTHGLKPGDRVVIIGPNHLDLAIPYYACHYNGNSMCAIDPSVTAADLQVLFSYIHPKMAFCPKANADSVKEAFTRNYSDGYIVLFDDKHTNMETFISIYNGTEHNFRPAQFDQSKIAAWLMLTSGTTGLPKVAIIPFDTLLSGVCCWWSKFTNKFERTMAMATIQWMSSLMFFISGPLMRFARVQSSVPLTPQLLIVLINKYKPNTTAWTPHLLGQFLQAAGNVCDLSSFKQIAIGGSSIEKPLVDKFSEKCDAFLYLVYGMTELLVPVFDYDENTPFGSAGTPIERYQYRIVDDDDKVLDKPFKTGELWIKGDAFFKGYLNNPEETNAILTEDGWVKTGDIFYKDDQDYYYFVERKRLLIKYTGQWISPLQLEEVIKRHPGVQEACVVGVPDPKVMELPVAAIVRRNGNKVDPQDIFNLVRDAMPDLKQLHGGVFFMDSLPITPSGKIHRAKIREIAFMASRILPK